MIKIQYLETAKFNPEFISCNSCGKQFRDDPLMVEMTLQNGSGYKQYIYLCDSCRRVLHRKNVALR